MGKFVATRKYSPKGFSGPVILASILIALIIGVGVVRIVYTNNLRPVSNSSVSSYFTVPAGTGVNEIASSLKQAGLIRSASAFKNYVRTNEVNDKLQAGTYTLSPNMSVQQIVKKMVKGDVTRNLVTFLPGKRLDQIKQALTKNGYGEAEVDAALSPSNYSGNPATASLPGGASLEGYLYPDSFQKDATTPATKIINESLSELNKYLTADVKAGFAAHGLSVYQGITLASIVYQESDDPAYMPTIAQVFLSRIAQGMALQSNVTADYASDLAGVPRSVAIDSPYNTYLHQGLPPGPIGNFTKQALSAVAHPSNSNYLYFVADEKTHKVYFSTTQDEHNALIQQHCPNTCAQP